MKIGQIISFANESTETVNGGLVMQATDVTVTITTIDDVGSWNAGTWTGGGSGAAAKTRSTTVRAYRSPLQLRNFE